MSAPMVTCALCNSQITKRSSLLIEPYGRICRSHPEVEQHKAKLADIAAQNAANKKLEAGLVGLQVMMIVEQLRMMAYMSGHSLELTLFAFSHRLPKSIRADVEKQVRERGPVTQKEAEEAVFMAAYMAMKGYFKPDQKDLDPKGLPPSHCPEESSDPLESVDDSTMKALFPGSPQTEDEEIGRRCTHKPYSILVEPKDFQDHWGYKYVRFADGKVLFCEAGSLTASHKGIVESGYTHPVLPGDPMSGLKPPAVSAGTIGIKGKKWAITHSGSDTAKLTRAESDEEFIAKELGPKWQHDPEVVYGF